MQLRSHRFTVPLVMLGALAIESPVYARTMCKPASSAVKEMAWKAYRARFPFLMQGVAHMEGEPGCTLIVIAEPPPSVRIPELLAEIEAAEQPEDVFIGSNSFGGDGWTKDLVVTIDSDTPEHAANTISLLHRYLYGTSFRAWTTDLDASASSTDREHLNLVVTSGDLNAWMFDAPIKFEPLLGGPAQDAGELLDQAPPGVYETAAPPLVAWVLGMPVDLADRGVEARQFAMASDLLLGSFFSRQRVVIVGRARSASYEVLPPLRTETIQLLANSRTGLGQSYERNSPLAGPSGPLSKRRTSWAPIFLSSELIDTEYGSLLNLTDQLLKSFSNAGKTRYTAFAYPDPDHFPFKNKTVYDYLGVSSIIYNWNTENFASIFNYNKRYLILAFRTTGALPLDYLPPPAPTTASKQASEIGRAYFAGLDDPNLARVVQYASLYHVFRTASLLGKQDAAADPAEVMAAARSKRLPVIEAAARTLLKAYASAPDSKLQEIGEREFEIEAPPSWPRIPSGSE